LLTLLLQSNHKIKEACNNPIYRKRLEGIYHIIDRKTRIETRVQHISELPHIKALDQSVVLTEHHNHHHSHSHIGNSIDLKQTSDAIKQVMDLIQT